MFSKSVTLAQYDPDLAAAIAQEDRRQQDHVELIASENYVSCAVMEAQGSQLTNKYAEGYPAKRYYGRLRIRRYCRTIGNRPRKRTVWRSLCQRSTALRFPSQPSRICFRFKTGRHHFGYVSGARRTPDPRRER